MIVGSLTEDNKIFIPVYWTDPTATPQVLTHFQGGYAYGINSSQQIVGVAGFSDGTLPGPAYWPAPDASPLPLATLPDYPVGLAYGINNSQQIVGAFLNITNAKASPVYWSSPTALPQSLPMLSGYTEGLAYGINNSQQIIGMLVNNATAILVYWSTPKTPPQQIRDIDLDIFASGFIKLADINDSQQMVSFNVVNTLPIPSYSPNLTSSPQALPVLPDYLVGIASGINNSQQIVGTLGFGKDLIPFYWSSPTAPPQPLALLPGYTQGLASGINDTAQVISNICFLSGTPIQTNQGIIAIEKLNTNLHTINNQPIKHITQTTTLDKYLICFQKDALGRNVPCATTIMSKEHKIDFEGQLIPAYRFLNFSRAVTKVKYTGQILYNVLLDNYDRINVNNLICETLHPENIIAKLYSNNYTDNARNNIIIKMNTSLEAGDFPAYKDIVKQLTLHF
jgi:hypothetical protein